ncbi:MAG: hypothetical protein J6Z11_08370 [Candidatus Riflebacteria bacterium]|nr:hypothetical protein [Candidatus Riflebacteria bacterium]
MSLTTDKRKINYFIACGYCLVILIILFNYLRTPRKASFREGTRAAHSNNALNEANKELENQLNEQKRMNKEMREMLIDIHNTQSTQNTLSTQSVNKNTNQLTSTSNKSNEVLSQTVKDINTKSYELPQLSSDISNKFVNKGSYPFEVDKNPFALSEGITETIDNEDNLSFHGHTVICNPILPYMFSSSNSDFKLISNY